MPTINVVAGVIVSSQSGLLWNVLTGLMGQDRPKTTHNPALHWHWRIATGWARLQEVVTSWEHGAAASRLGLG